MRHLIVYEDYVDAPDGLEAGDLVGVVRGVGPRDGEQFGLATVAWVGEPGERFGIAIRMLEGDPFGGLKVAEPASESVPMMVLPLRSVRR